VAAGLVEGRQSGLNALLGRSLAKKETAIGYLCCQRQGAGSPPPRRGRRKKTAKADGGRCAYFRMSAVDMAANHR
jgi:hypothetical protein